MSLTYWIAVCAAPVAILLLGGRLAKRARLAVIATCAIAWGALAAMMTWVFGDPSDIGLALLLYFVIAPFSTSAIAAVVATRVVGLRGRFVPAFLLGTMGWAVGIGLGMVVWAAGFDELWDNAMVIALPAVYAACGAVVAAAIRED